MHCKSLLEEKYNCKKLPALPPSSIPPPPISTRPSYLDGRLVQGHVCRCTSGVQTLTLVQSGKRRNGTHAVIGHCTATAEPWVCQECRRGGMTSLCRVPQSLNGSGHFSRCVVFIRNWLICCGFVGEVHKKLEALSSFFFYLH